MLFSPSEKRSIGTLAFMHPFLAAFLKVLFCWQHLCPLDIASLTGASHRSFYISSQTLLTQEIYKKAEHY